jgi:hypothetical protein
MGKIASSKEKNVIKMNDLFAQELVLMSKSHILYLSFTVFMEFIETQQWKDAKLKPLMQLLARIFALNQLMLDSVACYESGFFGPGSNELLMSS